MVHWSKNAMIFLNICVLKWKDVSCNCAIFIFHRWKRGWKKTMKIPRFVIFLHPLTTFFTMPFPSVDTETSRPSAFIRLKNWLYSTRRVKLEWPIVGLVLSSLFAKFSTFCLLLSLSRTQPAFDHSNRLRLLSSSPIKITHVNTLDGEGWMRIACVCSEKY